MELLYKKIPSFLEADGESTLQKLLNRQLYVPSDTLDVATVSKTSFTEVTALNETAGRVSDISRRFGSKLREIPPKGEKIAITWKHNLRQGAAVEFTMNESEVLSYLTLITLPDQQNH